MLAARFFAFLWLILVAHCVSDRSQLGLALVDHHHHHEHHQHDHGRSKTGDHGSDEKPCELEAVKPATPDFDCGGLPIRFVPAGLSAAPDHAVRLLGNAPGFEPHIRRRLSVSLSVSANAPPLV